VPFGFIIATLEITKGTMIIRQNQAMEQMQMIARMEQDKQTASKIITPDDKN